MIEPMPVPYEGQILFLLEVLGVISFAASGAMAAVKSRMDYFGAMVLAVVTTVGGGVIRDVILGVPVIMFMESNHYLLICVATALVVLFFDQFIERYTRFILFFDSVGLALFTAMGTIRSLNAGAPWPGVLLLAVVTAVGGGMIRDILRNERPYLLYADFYAMASLIGSALLLFFVLVLKQSERMASFVCVSAVFLIRIVVLGRQWRVAVAGADSPLQKPNPDDHLKPKDEVEAIHDIRSDNNKDKQQE